MDDEALTRLVRQLLEEHRVPRAGASRILARYGDGSSCYVCSQPIRANDVLYELGYGSGQTAEILLMHLRCFLFLERELGRT